VNPKYRPAIIIGMVFVLMAPYLGFVMYYSQRFPPNHWPSWFTNTILVWFTANFLLVLMLMRLIRRAFRNHAVDTEKARVFEQNAVRYSMRLVSFWVVLFLYGLVLTVQRKVPIERAIPAGAFLLFFIGLFGWGIYRAKRGSA